MQTCFCKAPQLGSLQAAACPEELASVPLLRAVQVAPPQVLRLRCAAGDPRLSAGSGHATAPQVHPSPLRRGERHQATPAFSSTPRNVDSSAISACMVQTQNWQQQKQQEAAKGTQGKSGYMVVVSTNWPKGVTSCRHHAQQDPACATLRELV
jgi:hypothetical protein